MRKSGALLLSGSVILLMAFSFQNCSDMRSFQDTLASQESILSSELPLDEQAGYDIFIVAGQSNSVGYGGGTYNDPLSTNELNSKIDQLGRYNGSDLKAIPATDKLDHWDCYSPAVCGIGFAPTFARHYVQNKLHPNRRVLLIAAGNGGTASFQWDNIVNEGPFPGNPSFVDNTNLLTDLLGRIRVAKALPGHNVVKGLLWHQGESDALCLAPDAWCKDLTPDAATYSMRLNVIFQAIRTEAGSNIPVLLGKFAPGWMSGTGLEDYFARKQSIEQSITDVATIAGPAAVVETTGLKTNSQSIIGNTDSTHFDAQSQIDLGVRYYQAFESLN